MWRWYVDCETALCSAVRELVVQQVVSIFSHGYGARLLKGHVFLFGSKSSLEPVPVACIKYSMVPGDYTPCFPKLEDISLYPLFIASLQEGVSAMSVFIISDTSWADTTC